MNCVARSSNRACPKLLVNRERSLLTKAANVSVIFAMPSYFLDSEQCIAFSMAFTNIIIIVIINIITIRMTPVRMSPAITEC